LNIFWRKTVRELAAQLDAIDELIHMLVVTLEEVERDARAQADVPPPPCCIRTGPDRL